MVTLHSSSSFPLFTSPRTNTRFLNFCLSTTCSSCLLLTQTKENLALLSEATAGLKTLDVFIGEKDYKGLRLAMRNPPIANLRSSARKVIIGIDNKDAEEKVCDTQSRGGGWGFSLHGRHIIFSKLCAPRLLILATCGPLSIYPFERDIY